MPNPKYFVAGIAALAGIACLQVCMAADSPEGLLKDLRQRYKKVQSLQADFKETFDWALTGESVSRDGRIAVTNDNRFKVTTAEQILGSDGQNVYRYNRVQEQVIIEPSAGEGGQLFPGRLLLNFADGFKAVKTEPVPVAGGEGFRLDLEAGDPEKMLIQRATLWASRGDLTVRRLKVTDLNGNTTTYYLENLKFDETLDSAAIHFAIPEGAEMFDLR